MNRHAYTVLMAAVLALSPSVFAITDDFTEDPVGNPSWELYEPVLGSTYSLVDGWWRVTIPVGVNLDHWTGADSALQLRRDDFPAGDFDIETRVRFLGSGDPDNPTWPPITEPYMASLTVYFSTNDVFTWGPQMNTNLVLQRSGQSPAPCTFDPGLQEFSLQTKKRGQLYSFSWRESDDDPWTLACTQETTDAPTPLFVGLLFKTWGGLPTMEQTFEFDYFTIEEAEAEPPVISAPCDFADPDPAWVGMPYVRELTVMGNPTPELTVTAGPPELAADVAGGLLTGWIPEVPGTVAVELEASNAGGTAQESWNVEVSLDPAEHDDEFDDDPAANTDFWELYEPQTGIEFSIVESEGTNWWRLDVPLVGDLGLNFDTWTAVDRAPLLRHQLLDPAGDFLIETRVRIDTTAPPLPTDEFLAGLLVDFGPNDIIHWNVGQERFINGETINCFMERSGVNNIAGGWSPDFVFGAAVKLRLEKRCDLYSAFWRDEADEQWHYAGSYTPLDGAAPLAVGLVMKTWGAGAVFSAEFDYFDIVDSGGGVLPGESFRRGDSNRDSNVNIADAVYILQNLFAQGPPIICMDAADANDDESVNIADAVYTLQNLFAEGPAILPPTGPVCGVDPTGHPTGGPDLPSCEYCPEACQSPPAACP